MKQTKKYNTRETLVRVGTEILTEKGFSNTGIEEILKQVGVPKGSFYHYFKSKEAFGEAVIDNYAQYFSNKLDRLLTDQQHKPLQRLQNFIEEAKAGIQRYEFKRGCLVGNLGQELGAVNDNYRNLLESVFLTWQHKVATCLREAQTDGDLPSQADCEQLASFFWIGWEGAILRTKLVRNTQPLDLFATQFFNLINIE
ncbi:TetR/AcrR family transcriptional regulator [Candidatus Albibeggiatoa sp. nov. NOAA]|uniref:acrylate utilization transcriptional regulator AcuR n=1 Tax=Candidatus Albibeggiatoa sp. nov. NOAA TaxID=3162724 RepID=UPI0033011B0E|nr:TetR/AcrR family transcriptional regulator [Thiotrichaceae bacterium]